jgi:hypothetical protein
VHSDPAWGAALMEAVSLTERDVAGTFRAMAEEDGSDLAAQQRGDAEEAVAAAQSARDRARVLRTLAG